MSTRLNSGAISTAAKNIELIQALQQTLDRNYRRLLDAARADWERLFGGKDPSDGCVSVRVHRRAGVLKRPSLSVETKQQARLA